MSEVTKNEEIIMKLLHYFITTKDYNPVVLHGAKDEIWLENLNGEYKIIRLVSNYIHNDEQLQYDIFKTQQIMKSIKKKTLSLSIPTLSIFVNLGDNVHLKDMDFGNIKCVEAHKLDDVVQNMMVLEAFPDIDRTLSFKEEGLNLFLKLTGEINKKTESDAVKAEDIFKPKQPKITMLIITVNIIIFMMMYFFGNGSEDPITLLQFGANNRTLVVEFHQIYRLLTSAFLHIGIWHLIVNMYSLFVIGSQVENFFGKTKYLIIYLGSAITGSLLSICFSKYTSAGASGAIFGLLGALLYFGYHYRLYLGNAMKSQIIPVIILNLVFGFMMPGIDNAAHIGGLIGGFFLAMACGVKYKSKKSERINGIILTLLYTGFMLFLLFH